MFLPTPDSHLTLISPQVRKRETDSYVELRLRLYVDEVRLYLDKAVCIKCDICSRVCPRQAVAIIAGEEHLDITIDPRACLMCEVCAHFCPVGAVAIIYNGQEKAILRERQALAPFFPAVGLDEGRCLQPCALTPQGEEHWCRRELKLVANVEAGCPKRCHKCLEACPRQTFILDAAGAQSVPQPDLCLRCAQCLTVCETGAIEVTPQFYGELAIDDARCPPDCLMCINLCPVKAIVREGNRVFLKTEQCAYCGVCVNICDQDAITLARHEVVAPPGDYSQAWLNAVAKLTEKM